MFLVCACRVDNERIVTNRPLAGTRRRGVTPEADKALEQDLLADQKECAEHVMLVDLGRNDVGKVIIVLASSSSGTFSQCSKHISTTLCAESHPFRYSAVKRHWLRFSYFA
jgi:isochorismate synthase EntC